MMASTVQTAVRYVVSLLASVALFYIVNLTYYHYRPVSCYDCFFHYGVPFAYYNEGGFAGGGGWIPTGVAADFALVLVLGIALAVYLEPRVHTVGQRRNLR